MGEELTRFYITPRLLVMYDDGFEPYERSVGRAKRTTLRNEASVVGFQQDQPYVFALSKAVDCYLDTELLPLNGQFTGASVFKR